MKLSNVILSLTNKWKPFLLKVFPYELLKKLKGNMIQRSFAKLEKTPIEPFDRTKYPDGINLVGNIKAETGLGQSCRLLADEIEASNIPYSIYQYDQLGVMKEGNYNSYQEKISDELPYNINIIHINPHELGLAFQQTHEKIWNSRYNIGFWLWELEEFPEEWQPCFHCVNEIWTPSEFISRSIRKKTDLPVVTIPYHVSVDLPQGSKEKYRDKFCLPRERFLFLVMYDRTSMTERKNPQAVLDAYELAFCDSSKAEDVGLVIKINNPDEKELHNLQTVIPKSVNAYFITEVLDRQSVNELIYCVDTVVSLHRAEGFGLVLAEAMVLGTPTIATNWSSNTEFMNSEVACMVDAVMIELDEDMGSFKKGNHWADPDIEQAAEYMKRLHADEIFRKDIARNARQHIENALNMELVVERIRSRIKAVYEESEG